MTLLLFVAAAVLLSLERICYIWVWRDPESFTDVMASLGTPVVGLQKLFYCFKGIQLAVFFGWCLYFGNGSLAPGGGVFPVALGGALIVTGQVLNASVFYRLGEIGVFYGNRFGHQVPWITEFPFSVLKHPQYVGALMSIWGFFLVTRFPHIDWLMLPTLETAYYILGAHFEQ
jgi:phosphatidyl-N-methylethanolamine N-methyltransferase